MAIVGGFDVHRAQITFDYLGTETGEASRGQVRPAGREVLRSWLAERFAEREDVAFAVEGCTGWRFVAEELARAGTPAHLAEPAGTATQRGRKKRAKTDRADARLLRELLAGGRLPESWVPEHVLEVRTLGRLYVALMDQRRSWQPRVHAQLFHQGVPPVRGLLSKEGRAKLADAELSVTGRQVVDTALEAIDHLTGLVRPLRAQLQSVGRRYPGPRESQYGTGALCAAIIGAELGDCRRFSHSGPAVRFTGRRHRLFLRREAVTRALGPAGLAAVALGALRSRKSRVASQFP
jgi:transposase